MRSSASTPSRPLSAPIPLLLLLAGEDHPKACTGRRLVRRGWVRPVGRGGAGRGAPIVLDPHAEEPLSGRDAARARRDGVLAVDCSWNRLADRGSLPDAGGLSASVGVRRRLPFLVAANPQHYGRLGELNTAEAFAAALYLLGYPVQAGRLLEGFRGGDGFLEINRVRLDRYRKATGPDGIARAERALFGVGATEGPPRDVVRSTGARP